MRQKKQQRLFLVAAAIAFGLLACTLLLWMTAILNGARHVAAQPTGKGIIYGLAALPDGFDPHINASPELGIPLRSIYDTLLYRDPQNKNFVAGLADSWTVSEDGLTYTFKLKKGVKFHDGTAFDASAVAANLDRITNPALKSQRALSLLGTYDHYSIVDTQTIQIVLKQPYAPFLDGLCQVYTAIASPKAITQYDPARYQFHQVGTGPFMMVDYVPGDHLTIRRNPNYTWGPSFYKPKQADSVEEIEFRFLTNPDSRAPALERNDVQIVDDLSPNDTLLFSANSDVRLYPQVIPGVSVQFLMNTTKAPTDNIDIRRALIQATNRAAVVDSVFQQFSPVAYGPLSAVSPFYDEKVKTFYNYDPRAALETLTKAGYSDSDGDKILDQGGSKFTVVMVATSWGSVAQVAQKIQAQWHDLGIDLKIRQVPNVIGLLDAAHSGDYNLIAYNKDGLDSSLLNEVYLSTAATKWTNYADGSLDSWLTRATESLDAETRQNMFSAAQNQIMDQALTLPIRDWVKLNGARITVGELTFDAYGWYPLLANVTINDNSGQ